jgi:hypothetical protein
MKINRSEKFVRTLMNQLELSGYVSGEEQGRTRNHKLLYSIEEIEEKLIGTLSELKSANNLMLKMQKEAQNAFLNDLADLSSIGKTYFSEGAAATSLTPDKIPTLEKEVFSNRENAANTNMDEIGAYFNKTSNENCQNTKLPNSQSEKEFPNREDGETHDEYMQRCFRRRKQFECFIRNNYVNAFFGVKSLFFKNQNCSVSFLASAFTYFFKHGS